MGIGKQRSASRQRATRALLMAVAAIVCATVVVPRTSTGEETQREDGKRGRLGHRLIAQLPPGFSGASPDEIRNHLANEYILGQFLTTKLRSVDRRCSYGFTVDTDFSMTLDTLKTSADESLSNECGQRLSSLLRTIEPNEAEFDLARKRIAAAKMRASSRQSTYLALGVRSATVEAYRELYTEGTPEKIWLSLDAGDFENSRYDKFLDWYDKRFGGTTADAFSVAPDTPDNLTAQHVCRIRPIPMVQQLDIAKGGWGQRAILVIDQGYSTDGLAGIENPTLRNLCPPHAQTAPADSGVTDQVGGILSCAREHLGKDKWLVVYSNERPVASLEEMKDLAQTIAKSLGGETCSETRSRIYVVNFTGVP
jgi:hypothetical protein